MDNESNFMLSLIEGVEKKKCLYDKTDPFYFNKSVKERAWKEIGEICGKSEVDCKHRWKLLRERFVKELKKMEAPTGTGMRYLDEWRFLQPMLFLKSSLAPRRTRDNLESIESDIEHITFSAESLLEPLYTSPTPTKKNKPTLNHAYQQLDETMEKIEKKLTSPNPPKKEKSTLNMLCQQFGETMKNIERSLATPVEHEETTDECFMKTVISLMKDLPIDAKDDFQASLMQELYRLRKNCRNRNK